MPAPTLAPRRRVALAAAAVAAVLVAALLTLAHPGSAPGPARTVPAPWEAAAAPWQAALGGDQAPTPARYAALSAWVDPALGAAGHATLAGLGAALARADLTGAGRAAFPGYWPAPARTGQPAPVRCTGWRELAASPAALAVTRRPAGVAGYAKVLVAYAGRCADGTFTAAAPGVAYVYAAQRGRAWVPVREWDVPAPASGADPQAAVEPQPWQLSTFSSCASPGQVLRDRIVVVAAFEKLCADAKAAGVTLQLTAAYRTRAEQAAVFALAVRQYGSAAEARKWVAYADAHECTSRHCSGMALDVRPTSAAVAWLGATAGCAANGTVTAVTGAPGCPAGATAVPRMARYGFAAPAPAIPGYLEFTLPVADSPGSPGSLAAPDCAPQGVPVADMVAAVFRCRLAREGVVGAAQDEVVAQALVVSRCESGWNAQARAFAGRFATAVNPADGQLYTQAGVFMLSAAQADAGWVPGGAPALADPVANINGAASLWLATRGWEQFGCATGTVGGFEHGPVLPAFGGPALPAWAHQF